MIGSCSSSYPSNRTMINYSVLKCQLLRHPALTNSPAETPLSRPCSPSGRWPSSWTDRCLRSSAAPWRTARSRRAGSGSGPGSRRSRCGICAGCRCRSRRQTRQCSRWTGSSRGRREWLGTGRGRVRWEGTRCEGMRRRHTVLTVGEADSQLGRLSDVPDHRRPFSRPHLVLAARVH